MSTATEARSRPIRTAKHRLFEGLTMGQPSGRLIMVEVYENEGRHSVHWQPVVALLTAMASEYRQEIRPGRYPDHNGRNHKELCDLGWQLTDSPSLEVYPVVAGEGDIDPPLYAAGTADHLETSNMKHRVVVPCDWSPDQDRENAIRIGRQLLADRMLGSDCWADLDPSSEASK